MSISTYDEVILIQENLESLANADVICVDETVYRMHPSLFFDYKENALVISSVEESKNWDTLKTIFMFFCKHNLVKTSVVFAIGGGALCDLVGLASSIYKRGVELILVPTTLLAMVDAAVGGKNGINFDGVKNLIGTIYLPKQIIYSSQFLKTLPKKELLSGFAECLKIGIISSFDMFENLNLDDFTLDHILDVAKKKWDIVVQDLYETHLRFVLNFGHTIGHALETTLRIPHGYAVAYGMLIECHISYKMGLLNFNDYKKIEEKILMLYGKVPKCSFDILLTKLINDKKNTKAGIRINLLKEIGKLPELREVNIDMIKQVCDSVWT